jgi:hypothetical protein
VQQKCTVRQMELLHQLEKLQDTLRAYEDERMRSVLLGGVPARGVRFSKGGLNLPGFHGECIVVCSQSDQFRIVPADVLSHKSRTVWFEAVATWRLDGAWEIRLSTIRRTQFGRELPYTSSTRNALIAALNAAMPSWAHIHTTDLLAVRDAMLRSSAHTAMRGLSVVLPCVNADLRDVARAIGELTLPGEQRHLYRNLCASGLTPWEAVDAVAALANE